MTEDILNKAERKLHSAPKKTTKKANSKTQSEGRDIAAKTPKNRPPRVAMVAGSKLTIPAEFRDDKKHYYRWMANDAGRVDQADAAYFEKVKVDGVVVMRKGPVDMYLMRLPIEYRNEDLALKKQAVKGKMLEEQKLGKD